MRARIMTVAVSAFSLVGTAMPILAHHAFTAEFDSKRPVKLQGVLTKVEWINPHSWFHVEVKKPDGSTETWMIEASTPNTLLRRGLKRDTVKLGTLIVVEGYQAKDGSKMASGRDLTLPDGRKLFMGSSDTCAPAGR